MPSLRTAMLAVATTFVAITHADYVIDPSSVPSASRKQWCTSEIAICPLICEDMGTSGAVVNTCDSDTLTYGCLCADNNTPNVSEYSLTLPYFVCTEWGQQCVAACGSSSSCSSACLQDHPCGALDPSPTNSTNSTTTATATTVTSSSTSSASATIFTPLNGPGSSGATNGAPSPELMLPYSTMGTLGMVCIGFAALL